MKLNLGWLSFIRFPGAKAKTQPSTQTVGVGFTRYTYCLYERLRADGTKEWAWRDSNDRILSPLFTDLEKAQEWRLPGNATLPPDPQ